MTTPAGTVGHTSVRQNNFDLIRLVAALQVVLFHGLERLGLAGAIHSVIGRAVSRFPGVPIFFVVSGLQVSLSFGRSPLGAECFRNRALWILPALWACLLVSPHTAVLFAMPLDASSRPAHRVRTGALHG